MSYFDQDDAVATMTRRASITKVDDDGTQQIVTATGLKGEEFKVYRQQGHGLSTVPPIGSEGYVTALGGRSDRMQFHQGEHKDHRPKKQKAGNTVLYDAAGNQSRYLGTDGIWHDAGDRPQKMTGKTVMLKASENASVGGKKVYLGGDGSDGTYSPVMTEAGPSSVVFAKV